MNSQQLGKFYIEEHLIRTHPHVVAAALRDMSFVPLRAEMMFIGRFIEYTGISPMFEECPKGRLVPEYKVSIIFNNDEGEEAEYVMVEVTKL